jgi:hypothetical protein
VHNATTPICQYFYPPIPPEIILVSQKHKHTINVPPRSSYTSTSSPRDAAYSAAKDPTGPAPTTTTFCRGEAIGQMQKCALKKKMTEQFSKSQTPSGAEKFNLSGTLAGITLVTWCDVGLLNNHG